MKWLIFIFLLIGIKSYSQDNRTIYKTESGKIKFHSEAKLEAINAYSNSLHGLLNIQNRNFAFAISLSTFEGFNAELQKEHFNENYMESDKYPLASFSGKVIEDITVLKKGSIEVRAKGILKVHGIEQERIIKVTLTFKEEMISVSSKFTVMLNDHNIKIPKIVHEKIASEITIEVTSELKK